MILKTPIHYVHIDIGFEWECPTLGVNWHRCNKYWHFGFWPIALNIHYGEEVKWESAK